MSRPFTSVWEPADDLAPFDGQVRTYVIASTPRSGSHYLAYLLHDTGVLGYPLEYLNAAEAKGWAQRLSGETPADVMRGIIAHRTSPSGWFGVKSHYRQFQAAVETGAVAALGEPRFIRIIREDVIAQAVSLAIAMQTKSWISGMEATGVPVYDVDRIWKMESLIRQEAAGWDEYLSDRKPITLIYEQLCADPDGGVTRVADELGIDLPKRSGFSSKALRQGDETNRRFAETYRTDPRRLALADACSPSPKPSVTTPSVARGQP